MIAYTLIQAQRSQLFDEIAVSSDSDEILAIAREWGATQIVKRPGELASDRAPKLDAIRHCVRAVEERTGVTYQLFADLDATSPLRLVDDIAGCIALLERSAAPNVITGAPARRSPYFNLVEEQPDGSVSLAKAADPPIVRRQDSPLCYDMNASIYVWRRSALFDQDGLFRRGTRLFVMPPERSVDIDSELDFAVVEFLAHRFGRFNDAW